MIALIALLAAVASPKTGDCLEEPAPVERAETAGEVAGFTPASERSRLAPLRDSAVPSAGKVAGFRVASERSPVAPTARTAIPSAGKVAGFTVASARSPGAPTTESAVPTAGEVAAYAVASARSLLAPIAELDAARRSAHLSYAPVVPELALSAEAQRLTPSAGEFSDSWRLRATVSQSLTALALGGISAAGAKSERAEVERLRLRAAEADIELEAQARFYRWVRAGEAARLSAHALRRAQLHRLEVATLVSAGDLGSGDLASFEARLARAAMTHVSAEAALARETAMLAALFPAADRALPPAHAFGSPPPPMAVPPEAVERALADRPELRAERLLASIAERELAASRWRRWPQLSLLVWVEATPGHQAGVFGAAGVLSWSTADFAAAESELARIEADLDRSRARLAALEEAVRVEVATSIALERAAHAAIEAAEAEVEAAGTAYRARKAELCAGDVTAGALLDADVELAAARLARLDAWVELYLARARLTRALGSPQSEPQESSARP